MLYEAKTVEEIDGFAPVFASLGLYSGENTMPGIVNPMRKFNLKYLCVLIVRKKCPSKAICLLVTNFHWKLAPKGLNIYAQDANTESVQLRVEKV